MPTPPAAWCRPTAAPSGACRRSPSPPGGAPSSRPISQIGLDLTRSEYLEFWVFQGGEQSLDSAGVQLVVDLGSVSEDALAIAPESLTVNGQRQPVHRPAVHRRGRAQQRAAVHRHLQRRLRRHRHPDGPDRLARRQRGRRPKTCRPARTSSPTPCRSIPGATSGAGAPSGTASSTPRTSTATTGSTRRAPTTTSSGGWCSPTTCRPTSSATAPPTSTSRGAPRPGASTGCRCACPATPSAPRISG